MEHSHGVWTRQRLEEYVGTTETLTLEFKSCRALISSDSKDRNVRLTEAAKDVAAMANEQGGIIIYGIEESSGNGFRRATALEDGFKPEDHVSREWFLQFIRDRVHPPLPEIDAVDVPLQADNSRCSLVVLVPQARSIARQTDDLYFWRRDAQGLRRMTVQEIEDVRTRSTHPILSLEARAKESMFGENNTTIQLRVQFRVANSSSATASFVVVTIALPTEGKADLGRTDWRFLEMGNEWRIIRLVVASGSSEVWSPITPGFVLATQEIGISCRYYERDEVSKRAIGLARLDYDGGSRSYVLMLNVQAPIESRLYTELLTKDNLPGFLKSKPLPPFFAVDAP